MTDKDTIQKVAQAIATATLNLSEAIVQPIMEATQGYRTQCQEAGFSPAAAEIMATAYHAELIKVMFMQLAASSKKKT